MKHGQHRAADNRSRWWIAFGLSTGLVIGTSAGAAVVAAQADDVTTAARPGEPSPAATTSSTDQNDRAARALGREARISSAGSAQFPAASSVLLVGDSLAVGIEGYVDAGLGERPLTVDAAEGRGSAASVSLLSTYATTAPTTWVVSLGTNDNPEEFSSDAAAIIKLAGRDRCVVWFDVWRLDTDAAINASLDQLAASHPNLHLIDWNQVSLSHPEWFSGSNVHPSSEGYAVRGQLAVDAVNQICTAEPVVSPSP